MRISSIEMVSGQRGSMKIEPSANRAARLHFVVSEYSLNLEALSKDELLGLLGSAHTVRRRDWLMLLAAYHHGLRVSEVIAIQRDDIADGSLTVRLKGSKATKQPLIEHLGPAPK